MPLTVSQCSVDGPGDCTPQRRMIAGSPQAASAGDDGLRRAAALAEQRGREPARRRGAGRGRGVDGQPGLDGALSRGTAGERPQGQQREQERPGWAQMWTTVHVRVRVMPGHLLDAGDHQLAELVDVAGLDAGDDVVRAGDVLGGAVTPSTSAMASATDVERPTSVWIRMYAWTTAGPPSARSGRRSRHGTVPPCRPGPQAGGPSRTWARRASWRGSSRGCAVTGLVQVPPGDDAAVVAAADGRVVATTDVMVQGRDWRDDWSTAYDVGWKVAAQNLSDVAAMGAVPTALLVGLVARRARCPWPGSRGWPTGWPRPVPAPARPSSAGTSPAVTPSWWP